MTEDIKGYRPPMSVACRAKCFDCTADFADGRKDCLHNRCPLYIRMPYRKSNDIDLSWVFGKWNKANEQNAKELGIETPQEYGHHLWFSNGKLRIPMSKIIRAKCFDCCSDYKQGSGEKGRVDCGVQNCPFYYWTPYRQNRPQYDWLFDLSCTKKHLRELNGLGITREEYVYRLLVEKDL